MTSEPDTDSPLTPAPRRSPLSAERWRRIVGLVEVALDLERPVRGAYLEAVTRKDPELRRQVHRMLRHFGIDGWVEVPTPEASGSYSALDAERIGPYRLLKVLGRGGMGVVYLAERRDREFERQVAVKVIGAGQDAPIVHQRFLSERQILARFDHPNIARLFEGGTTVDGRPFFVLEYIEGLPLDAHCEQHRLPLDQRLRLFLDVCSAVAYAHQHLVVHRDLKPSNILVDRDGKPKLLDFGIAKLLDPSAMPFAVEPTRTTMRPMTPSYAAPEQIAGARITTATDVYSLGVLLFRLLTGRLPVELSGQQSTEQMLALLRQDPPRPSQVLAAALQENLPPATWAGQDATRVARTLRGDLDNIVRKALRFEPEQRYASVGKLADDLRRFEQGEPVTATRDTPIYSLRKFISKYRWVVAATGLMMASLAAFSVASQRQAREIARERDKAEGSARDARLTRDFLAGLLQVADGISLDDNKVPLADMLDQAFVRLERGEVASADARAELFQVLAGSYESLRDYRQAARAWQKAAQLAELQGWPSSRQQPLMMSSALDFQLAADFSAAGAMLEAARVHSGPAEHLQIDLQLLDIDYQLGNGPAFRERADAVLASLTDDAAGELVALTILASYLAFRETQGAAAEIVTLGDRILATLGPRKNEPQLQNLRMRVLATQAQAYFQLGDAMKHLEASEELYRAEAPAPGERPHAGMLMRLLGRARARLDAGRLAGAEQDLDEIEEHVAKLRALDAREPRARYLEAKAHLLRLDLAEARGQALPQERIAASLELLTGLHQEMNASYIDLNFARALFLANRREEAKTLVARQMARGTRNADLLDLAAAAGVPLEPPPPSWQLALPAWLEKRLAPPPRS